MRKYVDGFYFQRCPNCGRVVLTVHHGNPVLAPLQNCGYKCKG
jgi:ribosomal protein S27AE